MSVTWLQLRQPESFQTLAGLLLETEWFPVENHCSVLWLLVTQLYVTLCDPMDYSLPGSSIHVIFQARILEQLAIILLWGIFQPFFFFFSTVSIYWEKVFLKILRDSVQMQCPLKTSLDFLICTQIIPWLLMETWEESVVSSTLFLFHPAFPPNSIPHLSSHPSGPSLRNPAVQEVHMQSKQRYTHLVEKHPRCFALNFKQHMWPGPFWFQVQRHQAGPVG